MLHIGIISWFESHWRFELRNSVLTDRILTIVDAEGNFSCYIRICYQIANVVDAKRLWAYMFWSIDFVDEYMLPLDEIARDTSCQKLLRIVSWLLLGKYISNSVI